MSGPKPKRGRDEEEEEKGLPLQLHDSDTKNLEEAYDYIGLVHPANKGVAHEQLKSEIETFRCTDEQDKEKKVVQISLLYDHTPYSNSLRPELTVWWPMGAGHRPERLVSASVPSCGGIYVRWRQS